ncbi:MAG TPA: molybdopterin-dependent oxidoreductase, partial [Thermoleophilia bacterium]|nr:molybdopterin-dependent oxidoreductase [Thermoleophilia bacterium]
MDRVVRTVCQASHSECGVLIRIRDGVVDSISGDPDHPFTKGYVCVKAKAQPQLLYHPDRVKHPIKRVGDRGSGQWERVSWDEALDGIAAALTDVKGNYGTESIGALHGTGPRSSYASTTLLAHALGSPNVVSTDWHICAVPTILAETATFGQSVMLEVGPDYQAAECIVVWGGNPLNSHPPRGRDILDAKRRGAKLIVVDPRRTRLAKLADLWLQVRPGTDVALALGMIHTIIQEGLYEAGFVEKWCDGFEALKDHVAAFAPEKVAATTWVDAGQIREAARLYATTRPAAFHHRVGVEQNVNSVQTDRAFGILIALTGNLDVEGGNLLSRKPEGYATDAEIYGQRGDKFRLARDVEEKRLGANQYPLVAGSAPTGTPKFAHAALAVEAMLTGAPYPLRALFCAGGNPLNIQDARRVWDGLKSLDLLVVADFFMTPVAELADYVLPVTTWLERDESCDFKYMDCIAARQKAVDPPPECRDDLQIAIDLVKRIPWADRRFLPWDNVAEFNDFRVSGIGVTFED